MSGFGCLERDVHGVRLREAT